jgi:hypothetical protein
MLPLTADATKRKCHAFLVTLGALLRVAVEQSAEKGLPYSPVGN